MTDELHQTTDNIFDAPLSPGEAWLRFFMEQQMAARFDNAQTVSVAQFAFNSGWAAAMRAIRRVGR